MGSELTNGVVHPSGSLGEFGVDRRPRLEGLSSSPQLQAGSAGSGDQLVNL